MRYTPVGQDDHSGKIVLHMPTLAVVVNQGAANDVDIVLVMAGSVSV
jgi:hypothetical protein